MEKFFDIRNVAYYINLNLNPYYKEKHSYEFPLRNQEILKIFNFSGRKLDLKMTISVTPEFQKFNICRFDRRLCPNSDKSRF